GTLVETGSVWTIVLLAACNLLFIGGSVYYLGVLRGKTSWEEIGFWPLKWQWRWLLIAIALSIGIMPLRGLLGLIVSLLLEGGLDSLQARGDLFLGGFELSWLGFALSFISVAIFVPISEELYFRGLLHRLFQPHFKFWPRVLLSSTLFALGHFDSLGVAASSFVMGVVIAIAYEKSRSLWLPIAIHMTTNGIAMVLLYILTLLEDLLI
ncbi:MAG: CPBP family intramembrane metalloprotease, partial [Anaerolineaceae bacterium]|nr:CPBP family intramembrane metalloprotease [Anaerolineaceae bacterium]